LIVVTEFSRLALAFELITLCEPKVSECESATPLVDRQYGET